jgi:GAF domain-containing protein
MATWDYLLPSNEEGRLQTLHTLDLPAALAEPVFQHLVDLAARVFNLLISFLSVVDRDEVDFALTHGIPTLRAVPREHTLCALPVRREKTFVINSVSTGGKSVHRITADQLGLEFYAGKPLLLQDEFAIGALCVSDTVARTSSSREQQVLEVLAALAGRALLARLRYARLPDGPAQWLAIQQAAGHEIESLHGLIRYLTFRYGNQVPTSDAVLSVV